MVALLRLEELHVVAHHRVPAAGATLGARLRRLRVARLVLEPAAAPVAVAAAPAAGGGAPAEEVEEKSSFDVVLEAAGDKKIQVIKEVRALTSLGLGEAKALVDGAPGVVLEGVNKETADKAKAQLEEAGATVVLK